MHVLQSYPPLILSSCEAFAATVPGTYVVSCQESGCAIPRVSDASLPAENGHIGTVSRVKVLSGPFYM